MSIRCTNFRRKHHAKTKTSRAAAKRLKQQEPENLREWLIEGHILTKKSAKRKRNLRKATMTDNPM